MIQELMEMIDELETPAQQDMVQSWFDNLDPFAPFLNQQSDGQQKWLYWMWEKFVNGDDESAREYYDE